MRPVGVALALFGLAASPVQAKDEGVRIGPQPSWVRLADPLPVPEDARGPVFIRRQHIEAHLDRTGQQSFISSLIRISDTSALQLGNVSLTWNPAAGGPVVHAIKVHRNGVERDVLASTKFEVLRRENQLETAVLDGALTAVLRVPDLRVGDELEFAYTLHMQDPTLGQQSAGMLSMSSTPPPGRFKLRLSWEPGQEPRLQPTVDMEPLVMRDGQALTFDTDNPRPLNPPKDAPPRYSVQRLIEFSDYPSWHAVSSRINPLYTKAAALGANSAIKREAADIATANADPLTRASAALKLVQQQVRYVYVGLNGGNVTPASAELTWQRRYGDCKGKTALLLALLGELGIPAEAVLVANSGADDGMDQRLPNPFGFDHILVRARIADQIYWLDGTLPDRYHPTTEPMIPYRWVLPLSLSGSPLEALPWKPATKPDETTIYEIDARTGFSAPAKIRQISIKRGPAGLIEYLQFSSVSEGQLESILRQQLEGNSSWNTIEKINWRFDAQELASVLEVAGTGPVDWDEDGPQARSMALPGGGFSPPERRLRGGDAASQAPFYKKPEFDCRVTTIRLPASTAEKDWSFNTRYNVTLYGQNFRRSFERRDGAIRMIRANRTLQIEMAVSAAEADNTRLPKFDNSMAWIYYDPNSYGHSTMNEAVPATYEVDWVRNPDACLAPSTTGK